MPPLTPSGPSLQQSPAQQQLLDAQKELLSAAFSQANAYTNLILGAGYAGFFAAWAFTKDRLTVTELFWSALLVTCSLFIFVTFELVKAFYTGTAYIGLARVVADEANFMSHLAQFKKARHASDIRFGKIWLYVFLVTAITGLAGGGILISAFVRNLFQLYF